MGTGEPGGGPTPLPAGWQSERPTGTRLGKRPQAPVSLWPQSPYRLQAVSPKITGKLHDSHARRPRPSEAVCSCCRGHAHSQNLILSLDLLAPLTHDVIVPAKSQKGGGGRSRGKRGQTENPHPSRPGEHGRRCGAETRLQLTLTPPSLHPQASPLRGACSRWLAGAPLGQCARRAAGASATALPQPAVASRPHGLCLRGHLLLSQMQASRPQARSKGLLCGREHF